MYETVELLDYSMDNSLSDEEKDKLFYRYVNRAVIYIFSLVNNQTLKEEQAAKSYIESLVNEPDDIMRLQYGTYIINAVALLMDNGNIDPNTGWTFIKRKYTDSDLDRMYGIIERYTGERYYLRPPEDSDALKIINGLCLESRNVDVKTDEGLIELMVEFQGMIQKEAKDRLPEIRRKIEEESNREISGVFTVGPDKVRVLYLQSEEGMAQYLSEIHGLSDSVIQGVMPECLATIKKMEQERKSSENKKVFKRNF